MVPGGTPTPVYPSGQPSSRDPTAISPAHPGGHTLPCHVHYHPCSPPVGSSSAKGGEGWGGALGRALTALQLGRQALGARLRPRSPAGWPQASHYTCLSLSFLFHRWDNRPYLPGPTEGLTATRKRSMSFSPPPRRPPPALLQKKMRFLAAAEGELGRGRLLPPEPVTGAQSCSHGCPAHSGGGAGIPPTRADSPQRLNDVPHHPCEVREGWHWPLTCPLVGNLAVGSNLSDRG